MNISGGQWRGKKLISPEGNAVRPTAQLVKDAVFNMLQTDICQAEVLDLFSGTGQMGLEALSRGAAQVTFADRDLKLTLRNAQLVGIRPCTMCGDFKEIIRALMGRGKKFDIIFADPPYEAGYYEDIITYAQELLNKDGVLVLEHDKKVPVQAQGNMRIRKCKAYGRRAITLIEQEEQDETVGISGQL